MPDREPEPVDFKQLKRQTITETKQLRKDLDAALQNAKAHTRAIKSSRCRFRSFQRPAPSGPEELFDNAEDADRHAQLAVDAIELAIMRLGMVLKALGNPSPYPESYNPESPVVEPTADGLKM